MAKNPATISLGEIVRTLDGHVFPMPCVSRSAYRPCDDCADDNACSVRAIMQDVRDAVAEILNLPLSELAARTPGLAALTYDI